MKFLRTSILRDHTSATENLELDLPTLPLSHLVFSLSGFNVTDEATLAEIIAFINKIRVADNGVNIINCVSEDLYAVNQYMMRARPILTAMLATDNLPRTLSLIVPFGRTLFNPNECYPARKKGELTLFADLTALATSIDNGIINIDAIQLPEASPSKFMKTTTLTVQAPGATGDNDVNLPLGNEIIAIGARLTTWPAATAHTAGIEDVSILVNEKEDIYASASLECLMGDGIFYGGGSPTNQAANGSLNAPNTVWLDFDPLKNGEYLLDAKSLSSLKARLNMGVSEASYLTLLELCDANS